MNFDSIDFETILPNITAIITTVIAIAEGIILYKKEKKDNRREKSIEEVWLPFGTTVEETLTAVREYQAMDRETLFQSLNAPLTFLKFKNRLFLPENVQAELLFYEEAVKSLIKVWNKETDDFIQRYCAWIAAQKEIISLLDYNQCYNHSILVNLYADSRDLFGQTLLDNKIRKLTTEVQAVYLSSFVEGQFYQEQPIELDREMIKHSTELYIHLCMQNEYSTEDFLKFDLIDILNRLDDQAIVTQTIEKTLVPEKYRQVKNCLEQLNNKIEKRVKKIPK